MKIFLIIILLLIFISIAIFVYYFYKIRHILHYDMIYICKYLKNNITFNKNNINILLSSAFGGINNTSKFVIKKHNNYFSKSILKSDKKLINDFFESLGKGDVNFEVNNLNYYEKQFEEIEVKSKQDIKEKGLLYFKLIIGFGLIVCVLLF